jgi:hypothetical protein
MSPGFPMTMFIEVRSIWQLNSSNTDPRLKNKVKRAAAGAGEE